MRIGILGGAFDPIHSGHIRAAQAAMEALELDHVLMLPSGEPPYKRCHASRKDRMRMVELACADVAGLVPCDMEIKRPGATSSSTLRALKKPPEDATSIHPRHGRRESLSQVARHRRDQRYGDLRGHRPGLSRSACARACASSPREGPDISSGDGAGPGSGGHAHRRSGARKGGEVHRERGFTCANTPRNGDTGKAR